MRDDDVMDELLRQALAGDVPELSPAFDASVMKRVRPGRLATTDRMVIVLYSVCLLYTSPSPRDGLLSRMPSSA